ncbi:MAG: hypothetical protein HOQ32_07875 [Lysobacter sp.]|nr:hypothetical protein [Lysobacter sp.]
MPNLSEDWIDWAIWQRDNQSLENPHAVAYFDLGSLVEDAPERAWATIMSILSTPRAEPILGTLAAGPLEDLLSYHGAAFIERVETEASTNPEFASLLGGVWQFQMPDEIWRRVQTASGLTNLGDG